MLRVGDSAPRFDSTAVVDGEVLQLPWHQLHQNANLVLLFNSIQDFLQQPDELAALSTVVPRLESLQTRLLVICQDELFEILTTMTRLAAELGPQQIGYPAIVDVENQIASCYDMLSDEGPLRGQIIADSRGKVRSIAISSLSVGPNLGELIRSVESIVAHDD